MEENRGAQIEKKRALGKTGNGMRHWRLWSELILCDLLEQNR